MSEQKISNLQTIVIQTMHNMQKQMTNLSIFKGDLSNQWHTLILGPSVG